MRILKIKYCIILGELLAFGLGACDSGSPEYLHVKGLPYSDQGRYAATLPLERRLDLQNEIISRSIHNPRPRIESSFSTQPIQTYRSILRRIQKGDRSFSYVDVLYEIDGSKTFKICSQKDRKIVQEYLWYHATDAVKNEDRPDFYTC